MTTNVHVQTQYFASLASLRRDLTNAKIALRAAKDAHEIMQAVAETDAIERGVAGGKNTEERARSLVVALLYHDGYKGSIAHLRNCEADVDRLATKVAIAEDDIRLNEARIRDKMADALLGKRIDDAVVDAILNASDEEALSW